MKTKVLALAAAALAVSALNSGCAEMAPAAAAEAPRVAERIEYGVVESVQLNRSGNDTSPGAGAVLGGIVGGVVGHQIGSGRGNDVATIAGALGGAYAGHQIQRANERDRYRVTVRLDSGTLLEVVEEAGEGELRVNDRVRVVNGRVHRE